MENDLGIDIWAFKNGLHGGIGVQFLSIRAKLWAKHCDYYADFPDDSTVWMDAGEYDELRDNVIPLGMNVFEDGGREH